MVPLVYSDFTSDPAHPSVPILGLGGKWGVLSGVIAMLIPIENVLSKDEVRQIRDHLDRAAWQDGLKIAGTLASAVKHNLQLEDGTEPAVSLGHHILRRFAANPAFISAALPNRIYPPKFNRPRMAAPTAIMSTAR